MARAHDLSRQAVSWDLRLQRAADLQYRGEFSQFRLMLVGVVLAEEKFGSGGQRGTHTGGGATPIAAISPG
jgi:hypothetical protein